MKSELKELKTNEAEGNELFAKFMELPYQNVHGELLYNLEFHKSWDWLMPVVEKWNSISKQKQRELPDYLDLDDSKGWRAWSYRFVHLTTDINYVYDKLMDAIKWYNETQSGRG